LPGGAKALALQLLCTLWKAAEKEQNSPVRSTECLGSSAPKFLPAGGRDSRVGRRRELSPDSGAAVKTALHWGRTPKGARCLRLNCQPVNISCRLLLHGSNLRRCGMAVVDDLPSIRTRPRCGKSEFLAKSDTEMLVYPPRPRVPCPCWRLRFPGCGKVFAHGKKYFPAATGMVRPETRTERTPVSERVACAVMRLGRSISTP